MLARLGQFHKELVYGSYRCTITWNRAAIECGGTILGSKKAAAYPTAALTGYQIFLVVWFIIAKTFAKDILATILPPETYPGTSVLPHLSYRSRDVSRHCVFPCPII